MLCGELEFWPVTEVTPNERWGGLSGPQQPSSGQMTYGEEGVEWKEGVRAESYGHSPGERW